MEPLLLIIVMIVVTAADPTMWIGPIVGAFASRKWWVPPALGLVNAIVVIALIFSLKSIPISPEHQGAFVANKLAAGLLLGFITFGIASLFRRGKKKPATSTPSTDAKDHT